MSSASCGNWNNSDAAINFCMKYLTVALNCHKGFNLLLDLRREQQIYEGNTSVL